MVGARRLASRRAGLPDSESGGSAIPREPRADESGVPGRLRSGDLLHERQVCWTGLHHRDRNGEGRKICTFDLMHVTHPLWLAELRPQKWWGSFADGHQRAARFTSRMSNERSADKLHPRKMQRVNPDSESGSSQRWQSRILLLNHTRLKWCPQPDSHQQPGV